MCEEWFKKYEKELHEFQKSISLDPRLPKNIDKLLLLRYLQVSDFDVEKSQNLLLLNLETRKNNPNLFQNRDISKDVFKQAFGVLQIIVMPRNTSENYKIAVYRLIDTNVDKLVVFDLVRTIIAMLDARFVTVDNNELINGDVTIIDMKGFTWRHFMKFASSLKVAKDYVKYTQETIPFRLLRTHYINCPTAMNRIYALIKPFIKKEIFDATKFHTSAETLLDYLPGNLLPNELGGTAGTCDDLYKDWMKIMESKRDYILNDDNWKLADCDAN